MPLLVADDHVLDLQLGRWMVAAFDLHRLEIVNATIGVKLPIGSLSRLGATR